MLTAAAPRAGGAGGMSTGAASSGSGAHGSALAELGPDVLQRILEKLPNLSCAAAAASFLRDAITEQFLAGWFLLWHERLAADRLWQYAAVAAWPRAAPPGGAPAAAAPGAAPAAGLRRLCGFLRAVLLRRQELGLLDPSGPGSTPHEAAAAAARVGQLLAEFDSRQGPEPPGSGSGGGGGGDAGGAGAAAGTDPGTSAAGVAGGDEYCPVARALLLLCPHSEHLLVPYLALGGHAGAMLRVLSLVEDPAPALLPWLAGKGQPRCHDSLQSAVSAAIQGGQVAAADAAVAAYAVLGEAGFHTQPPGGMHVPKEDRAPGGGLLVLQPARVLAQRQLSAYTWGDELVHAVEHATPGFIEASAFLSVQWREQPEDCLVGHVGTAAARKDASAAAMLAFALEALEARPGGAALLTPQLADRLVGSIGSATPEMADLAVSLASRFGADHQRSLLRHALGSPPLARLVLPRLAAAAPALLRPPRRVAEEIAHVLVESADSDAALEAATLLLALTEPPAGAGGAPAAAAGAAAAAPAAAAGAAGYTAAERRELIRLLAARRPASLLEWHWLHTALGAVAAGEGGPLEAQPLPISGMYWGVVQAALEYSYGVAAA